MSVHQPNLPSIPPLELQAQYRTVQGEVDAHSYTLDPDPLESAIGARLATEDVSLPIFPEPSPAQMDTVDEALMNGVAPSVDSVEFGG